jgi:hypothetical protein
MFSPSRLRRPVAITVVSLFFGQDLFSRPQDPAPRLTLSPAKIAIPPGQQPILDWPRFVDADGLGQVDFRIEYRVPAGGMAAGGGLQLAFAYPTRTRLEGKNVNPHFAETGGYLLAPSRAVIAVPVAQPQTKPGQPDFCSARRRSGKPGLQVKAQRRDGGERVLQIVTREALSADEVIEVTWQKATLSWHPARLRLIALEDLKGTGSYSLDHSVDWPQLLVTGTQVETAVINAPLTPQVGEEFFFSVSVFQGRDHATETLIPVEDFVGSLALSCTDKAVELPQEVSFEPAHRGARRLRGRILKSGVHYLFAEWNGERFRSHPIKVSDSPAAFAVYCGDLQRHSCQGGHAAVPDWMCWEEMVQRRDDFGAVLHHVSARYAGFRHTNFLVQQCAERWGDQFVAFPAYEWGLSGAHRHVIFKECTDERAIASRPYRGAEKPLPYEALEVETFLKKQRELLAAHGIPRIVIAHHSMWKRGGFPERAFDWGQDDELQRLVEVFSDHGSSECFVPPDEARPVDYLQHQDPRRQRPQLDGASLQDALKKGHRVGVIASSDSHTYPQQTFRQGALHYARGGLAMALGKREIGDLRERIWEGLFARRTYGTTGARILLQWTAEGSGRSAQMGEDLTSTEAPMFRVSAIAAGMGRSDEARFIQFDVWRDGDQRVAGGSCDATLFETTLRDEELPVDGRFHPYYVRLRQDDDHVVWSSPIWVQLRR